MFSLYSTVALIVFVTETRVYAHLGTSSLHNYVYMYFVHTDRLVEILVHLGTSI